MNYEKIYENNLKFLADYSTQLFDRITNQDISNLELIINDDGSHNIKENGVLIYPKDTKKAIEEQISFFLERPAAFYHKIGINETSRYSKYTDKIANNILKESPFLKKNNTSFTGYIPPKKTIPYLVVFGVGTGEYLKQILEQKEVLNLVIIDKDYSFLKLSMHLVDWTNIFDRFIQRENSFTFLTADKAETLGYQLINQIYSHNAMYCFYSQYLNHLTNPFFEDIQNIVSKKMYHALNGWGFFEDEKISLQHTLSNLKKSKKIYNQNKPMKKSVLIIGAGPSLDNDIEKVKQVDENVFIISCGSALRTLWKHDIYPDLHLEIERNFTTYNVLSCIDKCYLKKITLVGLNVLHPNVKKLFKESYMVLRDNDTGASLFLDTPQLSFTNPTVVNFAVNFAFSLKFSNIYLLGVDNGYKNPEIHHSEYNITTDEEVVDLKYKLQNKKHNVDKIKGNFVDEVFTDYILLWSKQRIENCITSYYKEGSKTIVYNCSDGAFIEKTIPKRFSQKDFSNIKKDLNGLEKNFKLVNHKNTSVETQKLLEEHRLIFEETITNIKNYISIKKITNSEDIYLILDQTYQIINNIQKKSQVTYSFLSGSIKIIYSFIYTHLLASDVKEEEKLDFVKASVDNIEILINYTYEMYLKIINNKNNF